MKNTMTTKQVYEYIISQYDDNTKCIYITNDLFTILNNDGYIKDNKIGGLYDYETLEIEEVKDVKSFMDEIKPLSKESEDRLMKNFEEREVKHKLTYLEKGIKENPLKDLNKFYDSEEVNLYAGNYKLSKGERVSNKK